MVKTHIDSILNIDEIKKLVAGALQEDLLYEGQFLDVSSAGITNHHVKAEIITREDAILCGQDFANQVLFQVDSSLKATWHKKEGDSLEANEVFVCIHGQVKSILIAERTALNFLQFLSAIATKTRNFQQKVEPFGVQILDTRKTIPGLRLAQKYATKVGGAVNHRIGLYDAILLKENHILASGGIHNAVNKVRQKYPHLFCEVEVENLAEFKEAFLLAKKKKIQRILIDNFSIEEIKEAVKQAKGLCQLEVSGGVNDENIETLAKTGVDFISLGALTKNIKAIDLSLRIIE